jgi:peptidoglycan/xylan/chitin deacetylase (PgdA/CDA1 family)
MTAHRSLPATLSLDLDDAWTYARAAGRDDWEQLPTLVPLVCERLLAMLDRTGQKISLFVVARDLLDADKLRAIRPFVERGHEIGCHSLNHDPCFGALPPALMREEVLRAADLIEQRLGVRPIGFRAPGFAFAPALPAILEEGGFRYDASRLPTFLGPICRLYYFFQSGLSRAERRRRGAMYGRWRDALLPNRPRPLPRHPGLVSIPVTTFPLLRVPFHMSYVVWLARRSRRLALCYVRRALSTCRRLAVPPSYLLHSLDYVGSEDQGQLSFFPGMDVAWRRKEALLLEVLALLQAGFRPMPLAEALPEFLAPSLQANHDRKAVG